MALKIDLDKRLLVQALEDALKAQRRIITTTKQPQFIPIVEGTIKELQAGILSITEVK